MADNPRIEELRRRVQKDPASIAFAQLAEEYRRAGQFEEAVSACRAGLERHPSYLSARVTLGRTLIELGRHEEAQVELETVLRSAPENLAAIRGLAEIHQRRGELPEALRQYQTALGIAKHDPDLEESVHDLSRQLGAGPAPADAAPPPMPEVPLTAVEPPPIPVGAPDFPEEFTLETFEAPAAVLDAPAEQVQPPEPLPPPPPPAPALSPELEAAADEFTKALQALDALAIELPTPEFRLESLDLPEAESERLDLPEPATPEPDQGWDFERFDAGDAGATTETVPHMTAQAAGADTGSAEASADAAVVDELESWLNGIVLDRQARGTTAGSSGS